MTNTPQFANYINGEWVAIERTFENRNPANTSEIVGLFAKGTAGGGTRVSRPSFKRPACPPPQRASRYFSKPAIGMKCGRRLLLQPPGSNRAPSPRAITSPLIKNSLTMCRWLIGNETWGDLDGFGRQ